MTGIERLREFVAGINPVTVVCGVTKTSYDREHMESVGVRLRDFLNDIADQIEREQDAMVKDSPYDALPPDEREAVAWVREHGGIAYVKDAWNVRSNLDRQLEKAQAKVERQQRHIEHVQGVCKTRAHRIMELNKAVAEMRPRLMPEGMEWLVEAWPRFEDGEPVRFEDEWCLRTGGTTKVGQVVLATDWSFALNASWYEPGERVKRPAPKVLDADGVEIELGDDLYSVEGSLKFHVSHVDRINGKIATDAMFSLDKWADPAMYTHRAPVLAADGRPLREGETVWKRTNGKRLTVMHLVTSVVGLVGCSDGTEAFGTPVIFNYCPSELTHERPDSWERLEEDAKAEPGEYCVTYELSAAYMGGEAEEYAKAEDLVRRAMALAGRDA